MLNLVIHQSIFINQFIGMYFAGYDGVHEFFPSLLQLLKERLGSISTDIPSIVTCDKNSYTACNCPEIPYRNSNNLAPATEPSSPAAEPSRAVVSAADLNTTAETPAVYHSINKQNSEFSSAAAMPIPHSNSYNEQSSSADTESAAAAA